MARVINQHKRPSGAFCGWSGMEVSANYPEAGCVGPSFVVHLPCPDSRVLCPAVEIEPGDQVEVDTLPDAIRKVQRQVTAERYVRVLRKPDRETPDRVVVHFENGSYGVRPDLMLNLGPRPRGSVES